MGTTAIVFGSVITECFSLIDDQTGTIQVTAIGCRREV